MRNLYDKKKLSLVFVFCFVLLSACTTGNDSSVNGQQEEKIFNYGTTAYSVSMGNAGLDPHNSYMGWSAVRYGVAETLFRFNYQMEIEPWLAEGYEQIDDYTVRIDLRDDVFFANGDKMTGIKVKECFERLILVHDRASADLDIKSINADGQSVFIETNSKSPVLLNYLSDPYGAIIDVAHGVDSSHNVVGTGPYIAMEVNSARISLQANENYWGGKPITDKVNIIGIADGDTLTMALQSGEIDAAQGLPYSSLDLFGSNVNYKISSSDTSRVYQIAFNFNAEHMQDINVRQAIAMALDKESFTSVLLNGNGSRATGAFPKNFVFGKSAVNDYPFDLAKAAELLKASGWEDTDGDGYLDKDGETLTIHWLTYPSRQELPLLAEYAQAALGEIGIKVHLTIADNHRDYLDRGDFDIYASSFVSAPTGDPQYYFTTHVAENSSYNAGGYYSEEIEMMLEEMRETFGTEERNALAVAIQQKIIHNCAYIYVSHLKMSVVMKSNVEGFAVHPSDFYEITPYLDIR